MSEFSIIGDDSDLIYNALENLATVGSERQEDMARRAQTALVAMGDELAAATARVRELEALLVEARQAMQQFRNPMEVDHADIQASIDCDSVCKAIDNLLGGDDNG
jgi:cell division septum initiation protein DivIVA